MHYALVLACLLLGLLCFLFTSLPNVYFFTTVNGNLEGVLLCWCGLVVVDLYVIELKCLLFSLLQIVVDCCFIEVLLQWTCCYGLCMMDGVWSTNDG